MSLNNENASPNDSAFFTPTQSDTGWNRVSTESVEVYVSVKESKSECDEKQDTIDELMPIRNGHSCFLRDMLSSDPINPIDCAIGTIDESAPVINKHQHISNHLFPMSGSIDSISDLRFDSISSIDVHMSDHINHHTLTIGNKLSKNISIVVNAIKNVTSAPSKSTSISTVASRLSKVRTVRTLMSFTEGPGFDAGNWKSSTEFRMTTIGAIVGLGNLWKFPTVAYQHGGGAFLIPYIVMHIFVGVPLFLMHLTLGQFSGLSGLGVWNFQPAARGLGISMMLHTAIGFLSYSVILAYSLYYAVVSVQATLPWSQCKDSWIARDKFNCFVRNDRRTFSVCSNATLNATLCKCSGKIQFDFDSSNVCFRNLYVYSELVERSTNLQYCQGLARCTNNTKPPSFFYFYNDVLEKSDEIGKPVWHLALSNLGTWLIVVLCLLKGIHSAGRVTYFTVGFPYVFMTVLIVSTAIHNQAGSWNGIKAFLIPSWHEITRLNVWITATKQVIYSLGLYEGVLICLSSYNHPNNNVYRDALLMSSIDLCTSIVAGFVVFMTLGVIAMDLDIPIEKVAPEDSYGLVFVVYPEALSLLGGSQQAWCFCFFLTLFTLGIDSQFCSVYSVVMAIERYFDHLIRNPIYILISGASVSFVLSLPYVTPAGVKIMDYFDEFILGWANFVVVLAEIIVITWSYGATHLLCDLRHMAGYIIKPHIFWMICYIYICPIVIGLMTLASLWDHMQTIPNTYTLPYRIYGWLLSLLSLAPIPCCYLFRLYKSPGENLRHKIRAAHVPLKWRSQKYGSVDGPRGREW